MCSHTAKNEGSEEGQWDDEQIKEAIVSLSHAVPYPGTVVIKPLWNEEKETNNSLGHVQRVKWNVGKVFM